LPRSRLQVWQPLNVHDVATEATPATAGALMAAQPSMRSPTLPASKQNTTVMAATEVTGGPAANHAPAQLLDRGQGADLHAVVFANGTSRPIEARALAGEAVKWLRKSSLPIRWSSRVLASAAEGGDGCSWGSSVGGATRIGRDSLPLRAARARR
jgi:hypothetical protein